MSRRLTRSFYQRTSNEVGSELIGKRLVRVCGTEESSIDVKRILGTIIEIELYPGIHDRASHVWGGKRTARTEIEYGKGGYVYIYLVYGMYWQFNITTGPVGDPQCILIRAAYPENGLLKKCNGPGKLCTYFHLNGSLYGEDLVTSKRIWIEDAPVEQQYHRTTPRININYAGPIWSQKKLRILDKRYEKFLAKVKS